MESTRGSRIKQARIKAGVENLREAAEMTGVSYSQLNKYERDAVNDIKRSVLERLASAFNTSADYLETGIMPSRKPFNNMPPRQIITDNLGREVILRVPIPAQAGYIQHVGDQTYLGDLKAFSLPGFESGTYRCFEIQGDSMLPTLKEGDWVICSHVEEPQDIKNGDIYVIVTYDGICVKRTTNQVDSRGVLVIQSDNAAYTPDVIFADDVREMWHFEMLLTRHI